jgi:hypothetical protein
VDPRIKSAGDPEIEATTAMSPWRLSAFCVIAGLDEFTRRPEEDREAVRLEGRQGACSAKVEAGFAIGTRAI